MQSLVASGVLSNDKEQTEPLCFETVIIGTGFSGLLAAIGLQKKKITDFVLLERSTDIGGTWRDNSYPGAEVDIPTGLYSISYVPYPFKKRYAPQSELLEYTNYVIDKFAIRKHTKTNQVVTQVIYNENDHVWDIAVASGEKYRARFVIDTSGVLANPHLPYISGAESFKGAQFHTARWDHSLPYYGKRVGVIGSGCSAAQVVPAIADKVGRLTLFMGKAQWIIPRSDRQYSAVERYLMTLPVIRHINRFLIFAYHESRFAAFRRYPFMGGIIKFVKAQFAKTLQANLDKYIKDDQLRQHMMPEYELGCRRVIPTNTYLPALARENVDVDISGIAEITETGIRTKDGKDIPLDIIVYATGFYAYSDLKRALSFKVIGRDGRSLNAEWENTVASYKGIVVSGYPNYFKVNGPNTGTGHSSQMSYMEAMVNYTIKAICAVKKDSRIKAIDVKGEVQSAYMKKMRETMQLTVWQSGGCTAFYRKNMTDEVTSLSPESMIYFIFSRKWFSLDDYNLLT